MHLFHFGPSAAPLAGQFDAAGSPRRHRPVLLLHPGGWEYLRAYRTLRQLASRLATSGFDVLRFDYTGTGDSWGTSDPRSVDAWIDDVRAAADELDALAGGPPALCIGLRLGARLALEAMVRGAIATDRLLLWDPIGGAGPFDGGVTGDGTDDAQALRAALVGALTGDADAAVMAMASSGRMTGLRSAGVAWPDDLRRVGDLVPAITTGEPPCWREERTWGAGALPVRALDEIVRWCGR